MIIPGVVSATFREKTPDEIIELSIKAGLKAIEWSENSHVMPNDRNGAEELRKKTEAAGLKVAAYGSYYRLGQNAEPEEEFEKSLISAVALHAPIIRVWAGTEASSEVTSEKRQRLAKEAALIGKLAEKEGIKIAFEWHKNTLTDTNESAMKLLEEANQDNLYCLWQPTVALSMEERVQGLDLLKERKRLLNLHVYYWLDGVRRPFSEGIEEWRGYLAHIGGNDERYALLEFVMNNTAEQFLEDAKALRELLEN